MNPPVYGHSSASQVSSHDDWSALQRQINRLGYAGLIPFVTLSALCLFVQGDMQQQVGRALIAYGAVIISFLGAHHWGASINGASKDDVLMRTLFAVSPALLGWSATLLPLFYGFLLVIGGLLVTYVADSRWCSAHAWYLILRKRLTVVATLSLAVAFISIS